MPAATISESIKEMPPTSPSPSPKGEASSLLDQLSAKSAAILIVSVPVLLFVIVPSLSSLAVYVWFGFVTMFKANQFLQAFLIPGVISVISYVFFRLYNQMDNYFRSRFMRTLTIKKQDPNYDTGKLFACLFACLLSSLRCFS